MYSEKIGSKKQSGNIWENLAVSPEDVYTFKVTAKAGVVLKMLKRLEPLKKERNQPTTFNWDNRKDALRASRELEDPTHGRLRA